MTELAKCSGCSPRFLEYVEGGAKSISIRNLFRLCAALGVRPSTVIRAVEERVPLAAARWAAR